MLPLPIPAELSQIAQTLSQIGGRCILVGGAVRDHFLGQTLPKDLDVEVYGVSAHELESKLSQFGKVYAVGKSFGVLKLNIEQAEYDFSLPRRESKSGKGHKGFLVTPDVNMDFTEAASRRDFTINSIGFDITKANYLDPFDGLKDIKSKTLRHVGPAFSEDPLRVLRAMQFAARLEFEIDAETISLCQELDLTELSKERMFEEFRKMLLKSKKPSLGLQAACALGILHYFPEFEALIGVPQDPEWHQEGDVWVHTLMVVDEAAKLRQGDEKKDLALMFSALCHDFGKPLTTEFLRDHWRSPAHDIAGVKPTQTFLKRLTDEKSLIENVANLVKEHLRPMQLYKERERLKSGTIRKLSLRINIPDLVRLAKADHWGRISADAERGKFEAGEWLLSEADRLDVRDAAPQPILKGRHLMALGFMPGPEMGKILKQAFEHQLNGELNSEDEAIIWAKTNIEKIAIQAAS